MYKKSLFVFFLSVVLLGSFGFAEGISKQKVKPVPTGAVKKQQVETRRLEISNIEPETRTNNVQQAQKSELEIALDKFNGDVELSPQEKKLITPFLDINHDHETRNLRSKAVVFSEDFSGNALPSGWSIMEGTSSNVDWDFSAGDATLDCSASGEYAQDTLMTGVIDVSGYTGLRLSFWQDYKDYSYGDVQVQVLISTNFGGTWDVLLDYTGEDGHENENVGPVDISSWSDGAGEVWLAFAYESDWGYHWTIDDIVIDEPPTEPIMTLDKYAIDFGYLETESVKETASDTVSVTNDGGGTLDITGFTTSSTDLSVTPSTLSIEPGNTDTFVVTLAPTSDGIFDGKVTIASNDTESIDTVAVSAVVYPTGYTAEGFEPDGELPFGWEETGSWYSSTYSVHSGAAARYASYSNTDASLITPYLDLSAKVGSHSFSFWWKESSTDNPDSVIVSISVDEGASWTQLDVTGGGSDGEWVNESYDLTGYTAEKTLIKLNYIGDGSYSAYSFYVDDILLPPIWVNPNPAMVIEPTEIEFSTTAVGDTASTVVNIMNVGGGDLVVNNVFVAGDDGAIDYNFTTDLKDLLTVAPGDTGYLHLYFVPTEAGDMGGGLVLHTNDPEGWPIVEVYGKAIPAGFTVEDFEGELFPPIGWTVVDADEDGTTFNPDFTYIDAYSGEYGAQAMGCMDDYLITPKLMIPAEGAQLAFMVATESMSYTNSFEVMVALADEGKALEDFVTIADFPDFTNGDWEDMHVDLDDYAGEDIHVAFHVYGSGSSYYDFGFDDIVLPPFELGEPELALNPEELFFGYVLVDEETAHEEVIVTNVGGLDLDITAMTPSHADFTTDFSATTLAPGASETFTVTYAPTEEFDGTEGVIIESNSITSPDTLFLHATGYTPISYYEENYQVQFTTDVIDANEDGTTWSWYYMDLNGNGFPDAEDEFFAGIPWATAGNDDYLVTPKLHINAGDILHFDSWVYSDSYPESFQVFVESGNDVSTWTTPVLDTTISNMDPQEFMVDLSAYADQDVYIGIRNISVNMYYQFVDNIYVGPTLTPIHAVQYVDDPETDDASPLDGQVVNVRGIVTAGHLEFSDSYFILQDKPEAWSGLEVYTTSTPYMNVNRGDEVMVTGEVEEYNGMTEIIADTFKVISTGNPLPDPLTVTPGCIDEATEGVLIITEQVEVSDPDLGYGEFAITDGVDTSIVDDLGAITYTATLGDFLDIAGIGWYSYGDYKLIPRDDGDIYQYSLGAVQGTITAMEVKADSLADVKVVVGDHVAFTDTNGYYIIEDVLEGTYTLKAEKTGYMPHMEEVVIVDDTLTVDVTLEPYSFDPIPPVNLATEPHHEAMKLMWDEPGTFTGETIEDLDFESNSVEDWTVVEGSGTAGDAGGTPYWFVGDADTGPVFEGDYGGMCDWGYGIDTWLMSPVLDLSAETTVQLSFLWNSSYYWSVDPNDNCDLYVKVSTDGGTTWDPYLWTYGEIGPWENWVWYETIINLSTYVGEDNVVVAFHLVGDDNSQNAIDNIEIVGEVTKNIGTFQRGKYYTTAENARQIRNPKEIDGAEWWTDEMFTPGATMTINFYLTNASDDAEWIDEATLDFPEGVTVLDATDLVGLDNGNFLAWDGSTGDGALVSFLDPDEGYGEFYSNETAMASITLQFDPAMTADIEIPWTISGDDYGDPPHDVSGSMWLETYQPGDLVGYRTFLDGDMVSDELVTDLFYVFHDLVNEQTYDFGVAAEYYPGVLSEVVSVQDAPIYEFGSVTGVVYDPNGDPVEGAVVNSLNKMVDTTGSDGVYHLHMLEPGLQTIEARAPGLDKCAQEVEIFAQAEPVVADFHLIPQLDVPGGLMAHGMDAAVDLMWHSPGAGGEELMEDFEGDVFPPEGWTQIITNTAATWMPYTDEYAFEGMFSAGVWWDYGHQDEWLITPEFRCGGGMNLHFWSYAFQGSEEGDHYYVKVSTDGGATWTEVFDLSAMPPYESADGWNAWETPYMVDLSEFAGQDIQLAWHAIDGDGGGLWYVWMIDAITVSNTKETVFSFNTGLQGIIPDAPVARKSVGPVDYGAEYTQTVVHTPVSDKVAAEGDTLLGYNLYRIETDTALITTTTDTFYTDLEVVNYTEYGYFVKAIWDTELYDTLESKPSNLAWAKPWKPGDVNFDNQVTVNDIIIVVNAILLTEELDMDQFRAADMNMDGEINIFDVIIMVDLTLNGSLAKQSNDPGMSAQLRLPAGTPISKEGGNLELDLDFAGIARGLQFEVSYNPEILKLDDPVLQGNQLAIATSADQGKMVVVVYSTTGEAINFDPQKLISIPIQLQDKEYRGEATIEIENVMLAGPQGAQIQLDKNSGSVSVDLVPVEFALHQNYPNPFNPTTTINFDLPKTTPVKIIIYNMLGQKVRTLVNAEKKYGYHSVLWNGLTDSGEMVSSGVYIYRVVTPDFQKTIKNYCRIKGQ